VPLQEVDGNSGHLTRCVFGLEKGVDVEDNIKRDHGGETVGLVGNAGLQNSGRKCLYTPYRGNQTKYPQHRDSKAFRHVYHSSFRRGVSCVTGCGINSLQTVDGDPGRCITFLRKGRTEFVTLDGTVWGTLECLGDGLTSTLDITGGGRSALDE
jgi:hypothetical protein